MPITFRAATTAVGDGIAGSTFTINAPAGLANDDFMVMFINHSSTRTLTTLAGWSLLYTVDSTTTAKYAVYYKKAAGEGASYTWTFDSTGAYYAAFIVAYSGVSTTNPIDVSAHGTGTSVSDSTLPNTAGSVTTTKANTMVLAILGIYGGANTFTPPTNYTERTDLKNAGGTRSCSTAERAFAATGATGDYTFTISAPSGADEYGWATVALAPNATQVSKTATFDAALGLRTSKTTTFDAMLAATIAKTATFDAALATRVLASATWDAALVPITLKTLAFDAALAPTVAKTVNWDAMLYAVVQKTLSFDAVFVQQYSTSLTWDALLGWPAGPGAGQASLATRQAGGASISLERPGQARLGGSQAGNARILPQRAGGASLRPPGTGGARIHRDGEA